MDENIYNVSDKQINVKDKTKNKVIKTLKFKKKKNYTEKNTVKLLQIHNNNTF